MTTYASVPLAMVTTEIKYGYTARSSVDGTGLRYVRITDIQNGKIDWNAVPRCNVVPTKAHAYVLQKGDILFARSGATVGKSYIFEEDRLDAIFASYLIRVRCDPRLLSPSYAHTYFLSRDYWDQILEGATGTGQPNFNGSKLAALQIPLPPLAEQRRIVARIEALFARTRRARTDLKRIAPLASHFEQRLLVAAMKGELTQVWRDDRLDLEPAERLIRRTPTPQQPRGGRDATDEVIPGIGALSVNNPATDMPPGWSWIPLLRIARQESGHTPSRGHPEYWDGAIPWIGIRDAGAHHGATIHDTIQHATKAGINNSSARILPKGTVCLSRTASVGYVTVMGRPMATSQDFATWTCSEALLPEFLKYALMAEGADIRRFGKGSTHTTIYFPEIRALHICLPPLDEQREIVTKLDKALKSNKSVPSEAERSAALLDHLEQSILTRAFRGELVSQDPNDEPASVGLARRASTPLPPKSTRGRPKKPTATRLFESPDYIAAQAGSGVKA